MQKVKLFRIHVDLKNPKTFPKGFVNLAALDATTELQIELQRIEDDKQARLDSLNKNA